jgi:hypothetical protein
VAARKPKTLPTNGGRDVIPIKPKGRRFNLHFDAECAEVLMVHCFKRGVSPRTLIRGLIMENCRDYHIHGNPQRPAVPAADPAGGDG